MSKLSRKELQLIHLLHDGWIAAWDRSGEPGGLYPACAAWRRMGYRRIHPSTIKSLVRKHLVECVGLDVLQINLTSEGHATAEHAELQRCAEDLNP